MLQGVKNLIQLIFNKAQPKRMQNSVVTGPVLAALVTAYVDAINKGAVPTIATAWQVRLPYLVVKIESLPLLPAPDCYIMHVSDDALLKECRKPSFMVLCWSSHLLI